ncbi:amidohydrolase [Frondihabitans sp. PAMC 28766]|uniref:amidohydrolase n=1 Tax=Frondihabitans sp. PAMC 28766 TaxID=1795630 RepID=UPI00078E7D6C|nr:amidohydrolase [Frondihabitans sp. PAMC 28766]AMM21540.1 amidohydrolase [Frondihabitans sp. PAMC 28766]
MSAIENLLSGVDDTRAWQEDLYRDLHSHPELSHQEHRTSEKIAERLKALGFTTTSGIGGTGVVGVLENGDGPVVLLRADMDALPVRETTGLDYASDVTSTNDEGDEVPVAHACGHDVHVTCLLGAADIFSHHTADWHGTLIALFQPAEETGDGARGMVDDNLAGIVPQPDVALAQHVLAFPSGQVGTQPGPVLSAADSVRVTVYGRGGHGSMPQATIDPVVLGALIAIRLNIVVSREVAPTDTAVLTVGSLVAGTKSNVIADHAILQLNLRTYNDATRTRMIAAIERIVKAECEASDSPKPPEFEYFDRFPLTSNDDDITAKVADAFAQPFGDRAITLGQQTASEDFSDIPNALGVPYTYWGIGGTDTSLYAKAEKAGRVNEDIPVNHSPNFAPVIQPTLDTGTAAMITAAAAWLIVS